VEGLRRAPIRSSQPTLALDLSRRFASAESPIAAWITSMPMAISNSAADWLYLTALQRYPQFEDITGRGRG